MDKLKILAEAKTLYNREVFLYNWDSDFTDHWEIANTMINQVAVMKDWCLFEKL